jgi:hypothetical protein
VSERDFADEEVKGITRYIPTPLSRGILLLLPGATWLWFLQIREHAAWLLPKTLTALEITLSAALIATLLTWIFIFVLFIDMALAIHQSKHRRIVQYSNMHPLMSFRFLLQNATMLHWLVLGIFGAFCTAIGFYAAHP